MALRCLANGDGVQRSTSIVAGSSNYTCCFWWRFTGANAIRTLFASIQDSPVGDNIVELNQEGSANVSGYVGVGGAFTNIVPSFACVQNVWVHVAYRRSGTTHQTYFNRNLVGSGTVDFSSITPVLTVLGFWAGAALGEQEFVYFREWNTALTITEIQDEANSPTVVKTANLWADTPLISDGNDISGNSRNWTVVGTATFVAPATIPSRFYPSVRATNSRWHGSSKGGGYAVRGRERPYSPVLDTFLLTTSKINSGTAFLYDGRTNQQPNYDFYWMRFVTRPLELQTIAGTFDCCFMELGRWSDSFGVKTADSLVRSIFHIYISTGQTPNVRHVLLNKFVESVNWPFPTMTWKQLSSIQTLTSGVAQQGDSVVIEVAMRIVSSPTPAPTYPPTEYTELFWRSTGTNLLPASTGVRLQDAVNNETTDQRAPWFQFSHSFVEMALSAPNANDACVDAVAIPSLPYNSPPIDTTGSLGGTQREAWYKFTADITGKTCVDTRGSTYQTDIDIFTGGCGVLTPVIVVGVGGMAAHRSQSYIQFPVTSGTEYHIRVTNLTSNVNAFGSGGLLIVNVYNKLELAAPDDIYYPNGIIGQWRNGQLVNFNALFQGDGPTGIAIDYTKRPIDSLNGGINSNERILIGLHNFELVELLDLPTLSYGTPGQVEEDFILDPWSVPAQTIHPAQLSISPAGHLYAAWFGNGYLYVAGVGTLPTVLNAVSNNADYTALKNIDATSGDNQPGAPFVDVLQFPTIQHYAPWAIGIDWTDGIAYYTSAGFYIPVPGAGSLEVRRFNVLTNTQLTPFAVIPLIASANSGLKGVYPVPGVGVFVANGPVLQLYSFAGILVRTYTPSSAENSQSLCGIRVTNSKGHVWVHDEVTCTFFQFNIATGVQTNMFETMGLPGTSVDFEIYTSGSPPASGIYFIHVGKTNDTLYTDLDPITTTVVKIPDPFIRTGPIGK